MIDSEMDQEMNKESDQESNKESDQELNEESDQESDKDLDQELNDDIRDNKANAEKKNYKFGIVYLSFVPEGLNVRLLRDIFGQFGEIGRIFLVPDKKKKETIKSKHKHAYVEGWIEFKKKRTAKLVAKTLNGKAIHFARRNCKLNGQVWSLKYLHRFKWAHLAEQMAYDKAVHDQKLRFGIGQAKKQVDFYQKMMDRHKRDQRRNKRPTDGEPSTSTSEHMKKKKAGQFNQNQPYQSGQELNVNVDSELLEKIFR